MNEVTTVIRHAGFKGRYGNDFIVEVNVPIDVDNHCTPIWPHILHWNNKTWEFLKLGKFNNNRIYNEVVPEDEVPLIDQTKEQLEEIIIKQIVMIQERDQRLADLFNVVKQMQQHITSLTNRIKNITSLTNRIKKNES